MRPVLDRIAHQTRQDRDRDNFRFVERALAGGSPDLRHVGILRARDTYGYDWAEAVQYANGLYAACAGWAYRSPAVTGDPATRGRTEAAFDRGFSDGGGRPDDLFDAARRAFHAEPMSSSTAKQPSVARARPAQWPKPSDEPRPVRWSKRLLILGRDQSRCPIFLRALEAAIYAEAPITIVAQSGKGYARLSPSPTFETGTFQTQLRKLISGHEFDDILVAADDDDLAMIDRHGGILPLCRTMERTRNSALQQRQQFRIWVARGLAPGATIAAGHIRWGKAISGLTGKLGSFTARYAGKVAPEGQRPKGHRIVIESSDGWPAGGFALPSGERLQAERHITNKSNLRAEMTMMLRTFAAAMPAAPANRIDIERG